MNKILVWVGGFFNRDWVKTLGAVIHVVNGIGIIASAIPAPYAVAIFAFTEAATKILTSLADLADDGKLNNSVSFPNLKR